MGLALWFAVGAVLVAALLGFMFFDQSRARGASDSLRLVAAEMSALPIASMRNGAQIVFLRQEAATSDTPFIMLHAGETSRLSAADIKRLWNRGRLWWYYDNETPPLGLSYYLRYLDGQYVSACRLHHEAGCSGSESCGDESCGGD
jgi:hypothetical protein